ncbi:hypothetical protein MUP77_11025 [Candidatus Bathyarchaeota archaeon]|nr:hypothetical protein [Candidatus Bathyarchaeota archaeon]
MRTLSNTKFTNALNHLEADGVLDNVILVSSASLRILGVRAYTNFIDLLVQKKYYSKKAAEVSFTPRYELEPVPVKVAGFSMRLGTLDGDLCSFRHLVKPYNVYVEVEYNLAKGKKLIKIRPHDYVRKDYDEALDRMVQRFDKGYWQEFYGYHKQIEAIDLGLGAKIAFGPQKILKFED